MRKIAIYLPALLLVATACFPRTEALARTRKETPTILADVADKANAKSAAYLPAIRISARVDGTTLVITLQSLVPDASPGPEAARRFFANYCATDGSKLLAFDDRIRVRLELKREDGSFLEIEEVDGPSCKRVLAGGVAIPVLSSAVAVAAKVPATTHSLPAANLVECQNFVGRRVSPISSATLRRKLSTFKGKTEFETKAQYALRIADLMSSISSGPAVFRIQRVNSQGLRYDAEQHSFVVSKSLFGGTMETHAGMALFSVMDTVGEQASIFQNVAAVLSTSRTVSGSYMARTGIGIPVTVSKVEQTNLLLFEKEGSMFPGSDDTEDLTPVLPMTATEAQQFKATYSVALAGAPKEPYLVSGVDGPYLPSAGNPRELRGRTQVIVADIQCALILDGQNKVRAAFPTN